MGQSHERREYFLYCSDKYCAFLLMFLIFSYYYLELMGVLIYSEKKQIFKNTILGRDHGVCQTTFRSFMKIDNVKAEVEEFWLFIQCTYILLPGFEIDKKE